MKHYALWGLISLMLFGSSVAEAIPLTEYRWTQTNAFAVYDDGVMSRPEAPSPVTSSGSLLASDPYPDETGYAAYVVGIPSFQFELVDALGNLYSWDVDDPWVVPQPFFSEARPFTFDFHLYPNNEIQLLEFWPIHEGYSQVGESGVVNIHRGTPEYDLYGMNIHFEGHWDPVSVPEPNSLLLLGVGLAGILAARRTWLARP